MELSTEKRPHAKAHLALDQIEESLMHALSVERVAAPIRDREGHPRLTFRELTEGSTDLSHLRQHVFENRELELGKLLAVTQPEHQAQAAALWGPLPEPLDASLRGHVLALGQPLWERGLRAFSPTDAAVRQPIQGELERWRALDLEVDLVRQAEALEAQGIPFSLDPRVQSAWFALDPNTGRRLRLDRDSKLPEGHWLSPGAALRPLMQSLMLPVSAVVLGPSERAYWRLCEPLWERVGLPAPKILPRPSVFVVPQGFHVDADQLDALRLGAWDRLASWPGVLPTRLFQATEPDPAWPEPLRVRYRREQARSLDRLAKLDHRLQREAAAGVLGGDPEHLRQALFPFGAPQERVMPGVPWLRNGALLDAMLERMDGATAVILVEEP